ncbi:MAG: hypothetical protein LBJ00_05965 [Planctomycetaceae bacterium]|nr:hypothetical protein [Planctomycetaceae bacterium]
MALDRSFLPSAGFPVALDRSFLSSATFPAAFDRGILNAKDANVSRKNAKTRISRYFASFSRLSR